MNFPMGKHFKNGLKSGLFKQNRKKIGKICDRYVLGKKKNPRNRLSKPFLRLIFLVRVTGLEPVRQRHTPLKRACLPIPAHSHIFSQQELLYHNLLWLSIVFLKKSIIFGQFDFRPVFKATQHNSGMRCCLNFYSNNEDISFWIFWRRLSVSSALR